MSTFQATQTRTVALLILVAMMAWAFNLPVWVSTAHAANVQEVSDTLSDSQPSAGATHNVRFTPPNDVTGGDTVRITFGAEGGSFDASSLTNSDFASSTTHTVNNSAGSCGAGNDWFTSDSGTGYVEYELCSGDTVSGGTPIEFVVGSSTGNQVTNPSSTGSYVVRIGGTMQDSGDTRVAIVDDVSVSAAVDTTFTFTVSGVSQGTSINGSATSTATTTSATEMNFGTLPVGELVLVGQQLSVQTNASNGFVVTVEADQNLTSSAGDDIDTFVDGGDTATPASWQPPSGTFGNEDTYGHMGLTSEDSDLNSDEFGSALFAGDFVNNPREVFANDGPADGSTADQGQTTVGYQIEIDTLQPAANDYSQTLTYVATPTF
jgi:hypothetical protein